MGGGPLSDIEPPAGRQGGRARLPLQVTYPAEFFGQKVLKKIKFDRLLVLEQKFLFSCYVTP
jgi:hypothetical protein